MEGTPAVSPARRAQLERAADDLIERAVDAAERVRASAAALDGWRVLRHKGGLRVLRPAAAPASAAEPVLLLGTGRVPGTVEDAVAGTFSDSTAALRTSKALLSDRLIDGEVLHVFASAASSAGVVFAGIKWLALKAPAGGQFIRDRDLLLYERQGRIVDRGGRFFAYHVYHSVDLPARPANRDPALARAFLSVCYLFSVSATAGETDCFLLGRFHPGGTVPPALGAFVAAESLLSVANAVVCAQARRFSRLAASAAGGTAPSAGRDRCGLCAGPLSAGAAACAGCGRRACRRCHALRPVFRLHPRTRRPDKDAFCRECVDHVARASGGVGAFRGGRGRPGTDAGGERSGGDGGDGGDDGDEDEDGPRTHHRPRSSSADAGPVGERQGTDEPPARARAGTDAAQRAARGHSLLFDPERQLYIRVFDGPKAHAQGPQARTDELRPRPIELRTRPDELRTRTEEMRTRTGELRSRPEELRTRPEELRTRPEELRTRTDELRTRMDELRPEEMRTRTNDLRRRPEELRRRPEELRPRPEELRRRPEELRPRPEELRRRPEELRPRPEELRTRPDELRRRPEELRPRWTRTADVGRPQAGPVPFQQRADVFSVDALD